MKVLPDTFNTHMELVFTTDKLEEGRILAGCTPNQIRVGVKDKPSQLQASAYAGTIAHELSHEILRRYYEKIEPDRYWRMAWNLTHYACYDRWGRQDYLYTKDLTTRPKLVVGYPVRLTLVNVGKLIKDQSKLSFPKPDGKYFV